MNLSIILEAVCEYYSVTKSSIFQKSRKRHIVEKRQIFQYLSDKYTKYSGEAIGLYYSEVSGNVWDHASVTNSKKVISGLIDTNRTMRTDVERIVQLMKAKDNKSQVTIQSLTIGVLKILSSDDLKNPDLMKDELLNYLKTA